MADSTLDRLDELIARSKELTTEFESLQQDEGQPPNGQLMRAARDEYMEWYTDCLALLPADLLADFTDYYDGTHNRTPIRLFLYHGEETRWHENEYSAEVTWEYPYSEYFDHPISEQRYILIRWKKKIALEQKLDEESSGNDERSSGHRKLLSRITIEKNALYDAIIEANLDSLSIKNYAESMYRLDVDHATTDEIDAFMYRIERVKEYFEDTFNDYHESDIFPPFSLRQAYGILDRLTGLAQQLKMNGISSDIQLVQVGSSRVGELILPEGYQHLEPECRRFLLEHQNFDRNVFIMTQFGTDLPSRTLDAELRAVLAEYGLNPLRADDRTYPTDRNVWNNVCTYMLCCKLGIAIIDNRQAEEWNANVALEYGFMRALNRSVLLLAERSVHNLRADVVGTLRERFDIADIPGTVRPGIERWLRDLEIRKIADAENAEDRA